MTVIRILSMRHFVFVLYIILILMFGCSSSGLSRDKAADIIKEALGKNKATVTFTIAESRDKGILYLNYFGENEYDEQHRNNELGNKFTQASQKWLELEKKGFLKYQILAKKIPNNGGNPTYFLGTTLYGTPNQYPGQSTCPHSFNCYYYDAFSFEFTSAAQPYVQLKETSQRGVVRGFADIHKIDAILTIATVDKVIVTGMTAPADMMGKKMIEAEYTIEYKLTPIGQVYNEKADLKKSGKAQYVLYDDGWRLSR